MCPYTHTHTQGALKNGVYICLLLLIVLGMFFIKGEKNIFSSIKTNKTSIVKDSIQAINIDIPDDDVAIGDVAKVGIIETANNGRLTGTSPFDDDNKPGNDENVGNNIVRSFDVIEWTLNAALELKDGNSTASYSGGVLEVRAELPEALVGQVVWDIDNAGMSWTIHDEIQTAELSDDGRILTAYYFLDNNTVTVPGNQGIKFILKVKNVPNGVDENGNVIENAIMINPLFTIKFVGNSDDEKATYQNDGVAVSAEEKLNIQLVNNKYLARKVTLDYGEGEKTGRLYGYVAIAQLYGDTTQKGLKGCMYPTEKISFDINLEMKRTKEGSNQTEDITNECTPILWNYKVNHADPLIQGREMYFGNDSQNYNQVPCGVITSNRRKSVYNSGNVSMVQNGGKINVNIENYDFDGVFPTEPAAGTAFYYQENEGCFSVIYFQVFVPETEATAIPGRQYSLVVSDTNMKVGENEVTQKKTTDDKITKSHFVYAESGIYNQVMWIYRDNQNFAGTPIGGENTGTGCVTRGQIVRPSLRFIIDANNVDTIYSATKFVKFDAECVEPILFNDGDKHKEVGGTASMTFKSYFVTKKDRNKLARSK